MPVCLFTGILAYWCVDVLVCPCMPVYMREKWSRKEHKVTINRCAIVHASTLQLLMNMVACVALVALRLIHLITINDNITDHGCYGTLVRCLYHVHSVLRVCDFCAISFAISPIIITNDLKANH